MSAHTPYPLAKRFILGHLVRDLCRSALGLDSWANQHLAALGPKNKNRTKYDFSTDWLLDLIGEASDQVARFFAGVEGIGGC
jgi:hypothetical protein